MPRQLTIELQRKGLLYSPVVKHGQGVSFGDSLAEARIDGHSLAIPSPASGVVGLDDPQSSSLLLNDINPEISDSALPVYKSQFITREEMIAALCRGGIWPFFSSNLTNSMPVPGGNELPTAIIVNFVLAEPFRARGRVVLVDSWDDIIEGIRFLPRLLDDYGKVHVILTAVHDPVAKRMYSELSGFAWTQLHPVPVTYPVEHQVILERALRRAGSTLKKSDIVWTIDAQGIAALGKCLTKGEPLHSRIIAVGGPGFSNPKHFSARIGSPVDSFVNIKDRPDSVALLRGGLLTGKPLISHTDAIGYDDDSVFCLPKVEDREMISFLRPGFNRTSYMPAFVSKITGAKDSHISTSIRGEVRPCIGCGLCEKICPVGILPSIIHRYLYRDLLDEALKTGLNRCIDCNLCTFICPSKIELQKQFTEAKIQYQEEQGEDVTTANSANS